MRHKYLFTILIVAILQPLALEAMARAEIVVHVSTTGDDAADGSKTHPLKSLHAAQQKLRERFAAGEPRWARVEIAAGTYQLVQPLVFTPADSGESHDHAVTFAAAEGQDVRISGGTPITGWQQAGNQWVAQVPENYPSFRDLWINGRRAIRARAPNDGYFRVESAGPDNRTSFVVTPAELLTLAHPETAEVAFLHDWSMSRIRLAAIDAATRTYRFDDPIGARPPHFAITNFEANPRYFVENAPELLDASGEWFFDEANRQLHYVPRDGETLESIEAVAPRLVQLVIIRGDEQKPVEHLNFEGVTFCYSHFDLPQHGYAGVQSSWYERRNEPGDTAREHMVAAVTTERAQNCRFDQCTFEHLAACGLRLQQSSHMQVSDSTFRDIGGDGVLIGADDLAKATGNVVEHCLIESCGATFYGAVGLWIGYASDTAVRHNEVRTLPYTGISVGWNWADTPIVSRGHKIENNHIHHTLQILSDGGGIYTLGRQPGTALAGNVIHDVPLNAGRAESNGIFMDEGSTDITVENNSIYSIDKSPIRFHRAGKNLITKNRLVVSPGVPAFQFNATDPAVPSFVENQEIAAADFKPSANDAIVKDAGPRATR